MIYGTYLSATGMANEQARQNLIANNLANAETNGFKRQMALFQERSPEPNPEEAGGPTLNLSNVTGGRWMLPTRLDATQGNLEETGNPLDVAVVGDGYLRVEQKGKQYLTRDGSLALDQDGTLVLAGDATAKILGGDGRPIVLKGRSAGSLYVDDRGTLRDRDGDAELAKVALSTADGIRPVGGDLFAFTGQPRPAADTQIRGGYVENSNVEPTTELTRLIESGRLLEANAKMITFQDQSLGKLLEAGSIG